jgi:hypothetical protein
MRAKRTGSHILEYAVEGQINSDWIMLARGTTTGVEKMARFPASTVWKVRLTILKAASVAAVSKVGLYMVKN